MAGNDRPIPEEVMSKINSFDQIKTKLEEIVGDLEFLSKRENIKTNADIIKAQEIISTKKAAFEKLKTLKSEIVGAPGTGAYFHDEESIKKYDYSELESRFKKAEEKFNSTILKMKEEYESKKSKTEKKAEKQERQFEESLALDGGDPRNLYITSATKVGDIDRALSIWNKIKPANSEEKSFVSQNVQKLNAGRTKIVNYANSKVGKMSEENKVKLARMITSEKNYKYVSIDAVNKLLSSKDQGYVDENELNGKQSLMWDILEGKTGVDYMTVVKSSLAIAGIALLGEMGAFSAIATGFGMLATFNPVIAACAAVLGAATVIKYARQIFAPEIKKLVARHKTEKQFATLMDMEGFKDELGSSEKLDEFMNTYGKGVPPKNKEEKSGKTKTAEIEEENEEEDEIDFDALDKEEVETSNNGGNGSTGGNGGTGNGNKDKVEDEIENDNNGGNGSTGGGNGGTGGGNKDKVEDENENDNNGGTGGGNGGTSNPINLENEAPTVDQISNEITQLISKTNKEIVIPLQEVLKEVKGASLERLAELQGGISQLHTSYESAKQRIEDLQAEGKKIINEQFPGDKLSGKDKKAKKQLTEKLHEQESGALETAVDSAYKTANAQINERITANKTEQKEADEALREMDNRENSVQHILNEFRNLPPEYDRTIRILVTNHLDTPDKEAVISAFTKKAEFITNSPDHGNKDIVTAKRLATGMIAIVDSIGKQYDQIADKGVSLDAVKKQLTSKTGILKRKDPILNENEFNLLTNNDILQRVVGQNPVTKQEQDAKAAEEQRKAQEAAEQKEADEALREMDARENAPTVMANAYANLETEYNRLINTLVTHKLTAPQANKVIKDFAKLANDVINLPDYGNAEIAQTKNMVRGMCGVIKTIADQRKTIAENGVSLDGIKKDLVENGPLNENEFAELTNNDVLQRVIGQNPITKQQKEDKAAEEQRKADEAAQKEADEALADMDARESGVKDIMLAFKNLHAEYDKTIRILVTNTLDKQDKEAVIKEFTDKARFVIDSSSLGSKEVDNAQRVSRGMLAIIDTIDKQYGQIADKGISLSGVKKQLTSKSIIKKPVLNEAEFDELTNNDILQRVVGGNPYAKEEAEHEAEEPTPAKKPVTNRTAQTENSFDIVKEEYDRVLRTLLTHDMPQDEKDRLLADFANNTKNNLKKFSLGNKDITHMKTMAEGMVAVVSSVAKQSSQIAQNGISLDEVQAQLTGGKKPKMSEADFAELTGNDMLQRVVKENPFKENEDAKTGFGKVLDKEEADKAALDSFISEVKSFVTYYLTDAKSARSEGTTRSKIQEDFGNKVQDILKSHPETASVVAKLQAYFGEIDKYYQATKHSQKTEAYANKGKAQAAQRAGLDKATLEALGIDPNSLEGNDGPGNNG